jgi:hypothetical protein
MEDTQPSSILRTQYRASSSHPSARGICSGNRDNVLNSHSVLRREFSPCLACAVRGCRGHTDYECRLLLLYCAAGCAGYKTKCLSCMVSPSARPHHKAQRAAPLANDNDDAIERPSSRPIPGLRTTMSCTKISHLEEPNQALVGTW